MARLMARLAAQVAALAAGGWLGCGAMAQEAAGDWHGVLNVPPSEQLRAAIHLSAGQGGGLEGTFDTPDRATYDVPLGDVVAKDGRLSFAIPRLRAIFSGTWDAAAGGWAGTWSQGGRTLPMTFTKGGYPPAPSIAGLDGEWDGDLGLGPGLGLRLAVHVESGRHGTIATLDSVDQGAYRVPVSSLSRDGGHVRIELKGVGDVFDGQISGDGSRLSGAFTQAGGRPLPLSLKRLRAGQPPPWPQTAGAVGLPANWQTPTDAEIRALLAERIDVQRQAVGIVVGVIDAKRRRIVTYGKSDTGRPLDGDTEFEIGSITKVFTGLVLADMAEKGEVKLDDPIQTYLPPGVTAPTRSGKPITLAELAAHSSGLPRLPTNLASKDASNPYADYSYDQLWGFLSSYRLPRDPGSLWEYSNYGFGLLGDLLARRAGTDYESVVKARVIEPLGMASTTVTLTPAERRRLAAGHDALLEKVANWDLPTLAGAGALRSTANDLMTFLAAQMGLTPSPLQRAMALALAIRGPTTNPAVSQALGWAVLHLPTGDSVGHDGGTGGYRGYIALSPERQVGVVVLSNTAAEAGVNDIGLHILTGTPVALRLLPPPPARHAVTLSETQLGALTGRYQSAPQVILTITREHEHLFAQLTGQGRFEVFPESPTDVFWKVVDAQATFTLGPDGRAMSITLHQNGRDTPSSRIP